MTFCDFFIFYFNSLWVFFNHRYPKEPHYFRPIITEKSKMAAPVTKKLIIAISFAIIDIPTWIWCRFICFEVCGIFWSHEIFLGNMYYCHFRDFKIYLFYVHLHVLWPRTRKVLRYIYFIHQKLCKFRMCSLIKIHSLTDMHPHIEFSYLEATVCSRRLAHNYMEVPEGSMGMAHNYLEVPEGGYGDG